jgi:hypothetical protein
MNRDQLQEETINGQTYWFAPTMSDTLLDMPAAFLLPPFDEFTVAYSDRSALQHPDHIEQTSDPFINLGPVIVIDGRVVGTWKRTLGKRFVTVALRPFGALTAVEREVIDAAARRYADFLGLPVEIA